MRYELKSIGVWAFIKVSFFANMIIGFLVGLLYGLFIGLFLAVMQNLPYMNSEDFQASPEVPFGAVMIMIPFICAIGGAIFYTLFGVICAVIYNLVAKFTGGMEFDLNPITEIAPAPQPMYAQTQMPPNNMPPPPPPVTEAPPFPTPPPQGPPNFAGGNPPLRDDEYPNRTVGG